MMIDKMKYVNDNSLHVKYKEIENKLLPSIVKRSRHLSSTIPSIDYDDALQEGKIAIIVALEYYDENKGSGMMEPYIRKVVKNAYYGMAYEALTSCKVPYVNDVDSDGNTIRRPCFPLSLDTMLYTEDGLYQSYDPPDVNSLSPESEEIHKSMKKEVGKFVMRMYNRLDGVDYDVFKCKVHPSYEFLDMLYLDGVDFIYRDEKNNLILLPEFNISPVQIGKYLGMDKNAVGWSLYKIRKLFLEMAKCDEDFAGLFDELIVDKRWPMIHMSKGNNEDLEFKRQIFKKRNLNSKQTNTHEYSVSEKRGEDGLPIFSRLIRWYEWGNVVILKKEKEYYTIIVEGRLNITTGAVFGNGIREAQQHIPLKWYRNISKELKSVG